MRNSIPLSTLREEVQVNAGLSRSSAHNLQRKDEIDAIINRVERGMATEDDWITNEVEQEVVVAANAQFVGLPNLIPFDKITQAWISLNGTWLPIEYGIGRSQRSHYDSTDRATPVARWEVRSPGNVDFEVWPIGSTEQVLRFTGTQKVGEMVQDTDVCTLDADVIVLTAAAEILMMDGKESQAQLKLGLAMRRKDQILMRIISSKRTRSVSLIPENNTETLIPYIDYIPATSD